MCAQGVRRVVRRVMRRVRRVRRVCAGACAGCAQGVRRLLRRPCAGRTGQTGAANNFGWMGSYMKILW